MPPQLVLSRRMLFLCITVIEIEKLDKESENEKYKNNTFTIKLTDKMATHKVLSIIFFEIDKKILQQFYYRHPVAYQIFPIFL